jgi:hypothetical protein
MDVFSHNFKILLDFANTAVAMISCRLWLLGRTLPTPRPYTSDFLHWRFSDLDISRKTCARTTLKNRRIYAGVIVLDQWGIETNGQWMKVSTNYSPDKQFWNAFPEAFWKMLTRIKHHPVMVVVVNLAKIHIFILFLFPFQSFCLPSSSLEKYSQIKCH